MELLKTAFVIILFTTASAKPMGLSRSRDADIADRRKLEKHMHRKLPGSSSSEESSESKSSEETSEEIVTPDVTTPVMTSAVMTTVEDGSTFTPEAGTGKPPVKVTTPPAATLFSTSCDQCIIVTIPTETIPTETIPPETIPPETIPTGTPITDNRGDN